MFEKSALYYDLFKSGKDYEAEALQIRKIIGERKSDYTILEIACGTGEHIRYLSKFYKIDGLDLNPTFIEIAKKKNPLSSFHLGDMCNFSLEKKYDAIICLYGGVGYVKTILKLNESFHCFKKHLNQNGLLIIEPWYSPENWEANKIHTVIKETGEISLVRMSYGEENGNILFRYLIGTKSGIEYFTEYSEFGLFSSGDFRKVFESNKFDFKYVSNVIQKRGLYIGLNY